LIPGSSPRTRTPSSLPGSIETREHSRWDPSGQIPPIPYGNSLDERAASGRRPKTLAGSPSTSGWRAIGLHAVAFAPLATVAAGIVLLNVVGIVFHLWSSAPKSAFDVGVTVAAARRLHGLSIYSDPAVDQASTMYGPVVPILTSWLFQIFGVSNLPGKLLSLTASLCIIGLVLAATARRDLRAWLIGGALLFACNHNVGFYFVEARPDMVAALFALLALFLFAEWERRRRAWTLILSLAFFVLAFFAKQSLAAAALVPLVAEFFRGGGFSRGRFARFAVATLPLVTVLAAIASLRATSPMAYFYMVTLPARYHVSLVSAWHSGFELLLMYASLLAVVFDLVAHPARRDAPTRWWGAAIGVFLITGIAAMAKGGGWWNSLLPFFVASAGFVTLRLPRALTALDDPALPIARRAAVSVVLAVMLVAFAVRNPGEAVNTVSGVITIQGDARYEQVVALARELPGRVRCPEDPTIPLLARGEITRSAFLEMDVTHWPPRLPAYVDDEIAAARYVIQVKGPLQRLLSDEWLVRLGFVPVKEDRLKGSVYHLWEKGAGSKLSW